MNTDVVAKSWSTTLKTFTEFGTQENLAVIGQIAEGIAKAFRNGNKVLIAGNGGSACDAMHFSQEFTGKFRKDRKALPVISFTDPAHITCVGNDYGFDTIFSRDVEAFGVCGDVFIAITTSGNSENIIKAIKAAKEKGVTVVALLGRNGGKLKGTADYELIVAGDTADKIQEVHMTILHIIIESVESILFNL